MDYKDTLNLPRTDFAMKADLVTREPERLKKWEAANLYGKIQNARKSAEKFVLHDGPPFANGDVHIGNALNKILKDIIVKYKTLRGFSAPYIPGWDCHGLPIEFKVSQEMRKAGDTSADAATIRKACDAYARKFIDIQRAQFKRLGVLGDWENPYLTLNKEYEADELRLFADIVEKGFVYRGKKPVYWSIPCRTALAEAEVEYQDHVSQSVFVKFPVVGQPKIALTTLAPETGFTKLREVTDDPKREFIDRYGALRALRHLWQHPVPKIDQKSVLAAVAALLEQGDMADLPIEDLRDWQRWEFTERILDLYGRESHNIPIVKRAIIRFALCAPNNPKAVEFVKLRRAEDAEQVKDIERWLELENPTALKKLVDDLWLELEKKDATKAKKQPATMQ